MQATSDSGEKIIITCKDKYGNNNYVLLEVLA